MEGVDSLVGLHKLELYDNYIKQLVGLENLANLKVLDMSFNAIRDMSPVSACPLLEELYLAQNKLRKIQGIRELRQLRILDLGANRIRVSGAISIATLCFPESNLDIRLWKNSAHWRT